MRMPRRKCIMSSSAKLSVRCHLGNENHHLWNNHGTWWCHYTVHLPGFQKRRVRTSLNTRNPSVARQLRDALLGFQLSAACEEGGRS